MKAETLTAIRQFTQDILHGDKEHRQWLLDECEKFIKGHSRTMKTGEVKITKLKDESTSITIKGILLTYSDGSLQDTVKAVSEGVLLFCASMQEEGGDIKEFLKSIE